MPLNRLKSALFGLAALSLGVPAEARLNDAALRDIRIYIAYEPGSTYENDWFVQDEFFRAARLGMQMWEGVLPGMRVKFVDERSQANVVFSVGNHYNTYVADCDGDKTNGYGFHPTDNPTGWIGCSVPPNNLGYINRDDGEAYNDAIIYFNTIGHNKFRFDAFTYESRQLVWSSYQPATFPPIDYNNGSGVNGNLGWINGRFLRDNGTEDATWIVVHEFGHCFGMGHEEVFLPLSYYGCPKVPGGSCSSPEQGGPYSPYINWNYYGCGSEANPCQGDLRFGSYKAHHMAYFVTNLTQPYDGIHHPPMSKFNFRVLRPEGIDYLLSGRSGYEQSLSYPNARGIIQLRTSPTGPVAVTGNWTNVIKLAELTNTHYTQSAAPYMVTGVYNQGQFQKVAAGFTHTLAIRADGTLWAWGANDKGQLGNGTTSTTPATSPVAIQPTVKTWVSVAAGNGFSLALRSDNTLYAWGSRANGQVGDGVFSSTPVTSPKKIGNYEWAAIKAGAAHVVALHVDGTLRTWGYNGFGQLGIGGTSDRASPTPVAFGYNDWVGLAAGEVNTAGQRADGSLWTWGWNDNGNVGDGSYTMATEPRREAWWLDRWQFPALGFNFSMNLDREGKLWTWGANIFGQLGTPSADMAYVPANRVGQGWTAVSAGNSHGGAIRKDGTLWSWGANESNQLGGGSTVGSMSAAPVQEITRTGDWTDLYFGPNYSLAMKTDGSLWAWGNNGSGQFGTGSTGGTSHTPLRAKWTYYPLKIAMTQPMASVLKSGSPITLEAEVTGLAHSVAFYTRNAQGVDNLISGTVTKSGQTYRLVWSGASLGNNDVVAKAVEYAGGPTTVSSVLSFFLERVIIEAGTVTSANLSTEGTVFWEHFGHAPSADNFTVFKNGAIMHFYNPELLNSRTPVSASIQSGEPAMVTHSWTQGSPSAYATGTNIRKAVGISTVPVVGDGFVLQGLNHGYRGSEYVAKLYVYARNVNTTLEVQGTGNNTWTQNWDGANGSRVYTIRYLTSSAPKITWKVRSVSTTNPKTIRVQALTLR